MEDKNRQMAERIALEVKDFGGCVYYVGGCVRDRLLCRGNKDIDIEVHGITPQQLQSILESLGGCTAMGSSFGVWGLKNYDLDIAMPRKETATGRGHKDFSVFVDPFLGAEKAALRRDFTVNAMMENVLTGEILDFFGGREDLRRGVIRHVNDATFAEDPLRVLRAAQFAARFDFSVAPETVNLCQRMDLSSLPPERIFGEMEKALLKAEKPSVFFQCLRQMGQLDVWFPELVPLIGLEQSPKHHPEGDVWNHTMLVLDAAASLQHQSSYPLAFLLSALCHDFGKAVTTTCVNGVIHSINHENEGIPIAERFITRLTGDKALCRYVLNMVELHMRPNMEAEQNSGKKATNRMFDLSVCPEDLILLAKADRLGQWIQSDYTPKEIFLKERLAWYRETMAKPCVMGRDLIEAGLKPGPDFSEALAYAHKLHLSGADKKTALAQTLAYCRSLRDKGEQK